MATLPSAGVQTRDPTMSAFRKATWRFLPFIIVCYFFCYLNRVNISFAKLDMMSDVGLTDASYGFGAGIFFIGYFVFEVPSALVLERVGARRWLARIMIVWGILSCLMPLVRGEPSFYVLRFLLGVAEAGFTPGILYFLTCWYPSHLRTRLVSAFLAAVPLSGMLGGPLSGWLLDAFGGVGGLAGWQWLFILEGMPSVVLGVACLFVLRDSPAVAAWLTPDERDLIVAACDDSTPESDHSFGAALRSRNLWVLFYIYTMLGAGFLGVAFWMPTLLKEAGAASNTSIGLLSALPYVAAVVAMIAVGWSSDLLKERRFHVVLPMAVGAVGLAVTAQSGGALAIGMVGLTLAIAGICTACATFWALPPALLSKRALAGGLALIASGLGLGGFITPFAIGWLREYSAFGGAAALYGVALAVLSGAALVLIFPAATVNK